MNHIVIGIPTYKRTALLEKLIKSIFNLYLDEEYIKHVDIVVVDNDKDKTGKETILNLRKVVPKRFNLNYFNNASKGLSHVRNEILEQAYIFEPDFVAFIDDDEHVSENWLSELTKTVVDNIGDMAVGPVIPEFEHKTPIYISRWFERVKYPNNKQLFNPVGSGNLILRTTFLKKHKLDFDMRFNSTGAEDTYFSVQALKKNAKIFWADNATVFEFFPDDRANLNWLLRRHFRGGNTYTYILIIEKSYKLLFKKILINFCYLFLGILLLITVLFPFKNRYYALIKLIAPSLGSFAAIVTIKYHEYGKIK